MYLTRLFLNTEKRETMKAMACPAHFHGAIESAFSGERRHPLWRMDSLGEKHCLLILSEDIPELSAAQSQFGYAELPQETKDYSPLLDRIYKDSRWSFRLAANPTYSKSNPDGRGKVCAHITPEHQMRWLVSQGEKHGFEVDENASRVSSSRWNQFYKGSDGNKKVTLLSVTYDGVLKVTDPVLFKEALIGGIGRGKAYGMGLITLVRCHE